RSSPPSPAARAPGWGWRWRPTWSRPAAAASPWKARRGRAPASTCGCRRGRCRWPDPAAAPLHCGDSVRRRMLDFQLDVAARFARLRRAAVRRGVVGRPPADVPGPAVAAAAGLQPGAGRVLLVVDVLRRGRHRGALRHRLPADLPGAVADADVRL